MRSLILVLVLSALLSGCTHAHFDENRSRMEITKLCLEHGGELANKWDRRWGGNYGCLICVMPSVAQPPIWNEYCDIDDLKHTLGDDFDISNRGEFPQELTGKYAKNRGFDHTQAPYVDIPEFRSVAILRSEEILSTETLKESNQKLLDAAESGAATGTVAGLAGGLVVCGVTGPLAGLCVSGLAVLGGITGGVGGLIYEGSTSKGEYDADTVNKKLEALHDKYDLQNELYVRLNAKVPEDLLLTSDEADILVSPVLSRIGVQFSENELMYLQLWGQMIFSWEKDGDEFLGRANFSQKTDSAGVEDWNADGGRLFEISIVAALDSMSVDMAHRIIERLQKGPETLPIDMPSN